MQKLLITSAMLFSAMILTQDAKATTETKHNAKAEVNVETDKAYNEGVKEGVKDFKEGMEAGVKEFKEEMKEAEKEMNEVVKKAEKEMNEEHKHDNEKPASK